MPLQQPLHRAAVAAKEHVRWFVGTRPGLYALAARLRGGGHRRTVDTTADICIEGYPRSANSFAVGAFTYAQSQAVTVVHHNHLPAPLLQAARVGVPALALIREPLSSIVSHRALALEVAAVEGKEAYPAPLARLLRHWLQFYRALEPVASKIVIASFQQVVSDFGVVVEQLNAQYGTAFTPFKHTEEQVAAVHNSRGYHAGPSARRDRIKQQVRTELADAQRGPSFQRRAHEANALYATLTGLPYPTPAYPPERT